MSIATAITTARTRVASAYTSCSNKGATMPTSSNQNLSNLATTISSINTGYPYNQTLQKWTVSSGVYTREQEYVGTITAIAQEKFKNNTNLVSVLIPDTVTVINGSAFYGCTNLQYVNLLAVTTVYSNAFYGCTSLSSINLSNVATIDAHAFRTDTSLPPEITIGATSVGTSAFRDCGIEKITLPNAVTIEQYAFCECKCAYVEIGPNCTTIGVNAFGSGTNANYSPDRVVVCRATTPPSLGSDAFRQYYSAWKYDVTIYVPYSANHSILAAYKGATNWSTYASTIVELNQDGTIPS